MGESDQIQGHAMCIQGRKWTRVNTDATDGPIGYVARREEANNGKTILFELIRMRVLRETILQALRKTLSFTRLPSFYIVKQ